MKQNNILCTQKRLKSKLQNTFIKDMHKYNIYKRITDIYIESKISFIRFRFN